MNNIQLTFTAEGVNLIMTALSELPAKHSRKLLNELESQLIPYTQEPQKTEEYVEEEAPERAPIRRGKV